MRKTVILRLHPELRHVIKMGLKPRLRVYNTVPLSTEGGGGEGVKNTPGNCQGNLTNDFVLTCYELTFLQVGVL